MSCDELIKRVGEMGLFQIFYLAVMGITKILCGVQVLMPVFTAYRRPYWCVAWGNMTNVAFQCRNVNYSTDSDNMSMTCPDDQWEFDSSIIHSTIQSQYKLICNREMLVPLSTSFFMGGFLVGAFLYGFLSDKYGRSKMSSCVALHATIVSVATAFSPSLPFYILGRFLVGIAASGVLTIANTTCVEILTAKWRLIGMTIASFGWIVGTFILLLIAYFQRNHTYLQLISSAAAVPGLLCYFILPEPLRWLIVNDHIETAYKVAVKMARINKRPLLQRKEFDDYVSKIKALSEFNVSYQSDSLNNSENRLSIWSKLKEQFAFLRYNNLRRVTLIMWFLFAATSFIAYSYQFSIGRFDDNLYFNVLIMSLISPAQYIPVYVFGHCFGRIKILITTYGLCGILTCALIWLYKTEKYAQYAVWVALSAKFFVLVAFLIIWLLGSEIYPTQFRTSAVGSCSTWARVGGLLSPQVIYLDLIWRPLPFLIYGIVAFLACVASVFLPETKGIPTLETASDGELFSKYNRLWRKRWLPQNQAEQHGEKLLQLSNENKMTDGSEKI